MADSYSNTKRVLLIFSVALALLGLFMTFLIRSAMRKQEAAPLKSGRSTIQLPTPAPQQREAAQNFEEKILPLKRGDGDTEFQWNTAFQGDAEFGRDVEKVEKPSYNQETPAPTETASMTKVKKVKEEKAPTLQYIAEGTPIQQSTTTESKTEEVIITEEEIFFMMNPPEFIDTLTFYQDQLIQLGEIKETERVVINSEENLVAFLLRGLEYLEKQNVLSSEDAERFKTFLKEEYLNIRKQEAVELRQKTERNHSGSSSLSIKKFSRRPPAPLTLTAPPQIQLSQKLGIVNVIKILSHTFLPKHVNAAWVNMGNICYKDDNPSYFVAGQNLWAPCCNCGLRCRKGSCTPVYDCGPYGARCDIQLGCLNMACRSWPNAIWDMQTGICGCG